MNSGHSSRSFSRVAASVDKPVFVFLPGLRRRSSYRIWRSWIGELRLKSRPTTSRSRSVRRRVSAVSRALSPSSSLRSTAMPSSSMRASTRTSGFSMSA